MKSIHVFFVLILSLFCVQSAFSDEFLGTSSRWPIIQTNAIVSSESLDYIYVGDGDTLNVYDKSTMQRVAYLRLDNVSEGFRSLIYDPEKECIYAACGHSGVQIIDVSIPESPTVFENTFTTSDNPTAGTDVIAYDIALHGNFLFIADKNSCVRILNISDPQDPLEVGFKNFATMTTPMTPLKIGIYSTGMLENVWIVLITVTKNSVSLIARFEVLDFTSSPITIAETGSGAELPTFMGVGSFLVEGDYAYCLDNYYEDLYVFNLDHKYLVDKEEDPELIFSQMNNDYYDDFPLALYNPRGFCKMGDFLYVATHGLYDPDDDYEDLYGITQIDISTLKDKDSNGKSLFTPEFADRYGLTGTNSIYIEDDYAYVTSVHDGVAKVELTTESNFNVTKSTTMTNSHHISIEKENGIIYVCDNKPTTETESRGLTILRAKPDTKTTVTVVELEDGSTDNIEDTTILRPAYPGIPMRERFIETPGTAKASCFTPDLYYAYIADGSEGIQVLALKSTDEAVKPSNPILIEDSNIPAPAGYEVIDVSVDELIVEGATYVYLMALTTDPNGELLIVDITEGTSLDSPTTFTPQTIDLEGTTIPNNVCAYHFNSNLYAFVARGPEGLAIIHLNPDWNNPGEIVIPPQSDQIFHVDYSNAMRVYVNNRNDYGSVNKTDYFAYVANGEGGVSILQLFDPLVNSSNINPVIINTINTSNCGFNAETWEGDASLLPECANAVDLHIYSSSVSRFMYILTDNPYYSVLLYDIANLLNPVYQGSTGTFGKPSGIWATQMMFASDTSETGSAYIRGVFIADGPGGVAFRQVTDETETVDRKWKDDKTKFCFISSTSDSDSQGLIPLFGLCLIAVTVFGFMAITRCFPKKYF